MPDDPPPIVEQVVVPAGPTLHESARWVGHACWAELRWHEVLTGWMAAADDHDAPVRLWSLRADAGERATMWHHRLPELSELPRHGFLTCSSDDVATCFDQLTTVVDAGDRARATLAVLDALVAGYSARRATAVGPADGPVARSLADAVIGLERSLAELPTPTGAPWTVPPLP